MSACVASQHASRPGLTYLHGVRSTELHLCKVPGGTAWTVHSPDLLIQASHIPSVKSKDIVVALLKLVIEREAARHGGCGHRRDELGHLLEVLDINRVHVHIVAWKSYKQNTGEDRRVSCR